MSAHSGEGADPNLTPMLDLVFQLITFFMLVINFKGAAMDLSLKLPVLGSARPLDYKGRYEPLLLNINAEGQVEAFSEKINIDEFIKREARIVKSQLKANGDEPKDGELPVPVVIRADKSAVLHAEPRNPRLPGPGLSTVCTQRDDARGWLLR